MSKQCSIKAHVVTKSGDVVESILFNDLLKFSGNDRKFTNDYYKVATDEEFLDAVRNIAEFDENDEITFKSLKEITNMNISDNKIIRGLDKDLGAGIYDQAEAFFKIDAFNTQNKFKKKYLATVRLTSFGKYAVYVVPNTAVNREALNEAVYKASLKNQLVTLIKNNQADSSFLENPITQLQEIAKINETVQSMYDLANFIMGTKLNQEQALGVANILLESMPNSKFMERLVAAITPEILNTISEKPVETTTLTEREKREGAKLLLSQYISNLVGTSHPLNSLLSKVVMEAKSTYKNLEKEDVNIVGLRAKQATEQLLGEQTKPSKNIETIDSSSLSNNLNNYKTTIKHLKILAANFKSNNSNKTKAIEELVREVENGVNLNLVSGELADMLAMESIATAIENLSNMFITVANELDSINLDDLESLNSDFKKYAGIVHDARNFYKTAKAIIDLVHNETNSYNQRVPIYKRITNAVLNISAKPEPTQIIGGVTTEFSLLNNVGEIEMTSLANMASNLSKLISGNTEHSFINALQNASIKLYTMLLEQFHSKDTITTISSKVFNTRREYKSNKPFLYTTYTDENGVHVEKIQNIVQEAPRDISYLERYIFTASQCPDTVINMVDQLLKLVKKQAKNATYEAQANLLTLERKAKDAGLKDPADFYEISIATGRRTNNFVSRYCWGDYEANYQKMREAVRTQFFNETDTRRMSRAQLEHAFIIYLKPHEKRFHDLNSTYDKQEHMMVPNQNYENPQYQKLFANNKELEAIYEELITFKNTIDEKYLPQNSTKPFRAPQFKESKLLSVALQRMKDGEGLSAVKNEFQDRLNEYIKVNSDDSDFGSHLTDNSIEDNDFISYEDLDIDIARRIPLYGINKIKNPSRLHRNVFESMVLYADMAYKYEAFSNVRASLEIGQDLMEERRSAKNPQKRLEKIPARYKALLDKHVYGVGVRRVSVGKIIWNNLINVLALLPAVMYLGKNLGGGVANLVIGISRTGIEAFSGEFFGLRSWSKAVAYYTANIVPLMLNWGNNTPNHRLSLILDRLDIQGRFSSNTRKHNSRFENIVNFDLIFLPYTAGDHMMQAITYITLLMDTKVYDENNKKISYLKALEKMSVDENYKKSTKIVGLKGKYFKTADGKATYDELIALKETFMFMSTHGGQFQNDITPRGEEILKRLEILPPSGKFDVAIFQKEDYSNIISKLDLELENIVFNLKDEQALIAKAQEINKGLHGVMHKDDKVELQDNALGALALGLKSYALGYMSYEFNAQHYNKGLDKQTEGVKISLAKTLVHTFTAFYETDTIDQKTGKPKKVWGAGRKLKFLANIIGAMALPGSFRSKEFIEAFEKEGFSEFQFRNIKRQGGALWVILLSYLLMQLALAHKPAGDDDDDDDEEGDNDDIDLWGALYYVVARLNYETSAWSMTSVGTTLAQGGSLADVIPPSFRAFYEIVIMVDLAIGALVYEYTDPKEYERRRGEELPEELKEINKLYFETQNRNGKKVGDPKINAKVRKLWNKPERFLKDGYNMAKSYMFSQTVKR